MAFRKIDWPCDAVISDWLGLDWSQAKIAKQIGCSENAVMKRIGRRKIAPTSFPPFQEIKGRGLVRSRAEEAYSA
jgi:hypothetical protein